MNKANQDTVNNDLILEAQLNYWAFKKDLVFAEALKPRLFIDGDKWCCLYDDNLQEGVAGFGDTPIAAILDFNKSMYQKH